MMAAPNPDDALYGAFRRVTPREVSALLDGYPRRWWISGGWALEAFTGIPRPHEDIDVSIDRSDLPDLVRHLRRTHHIWAVGSRSLRAITEPEESLPKWAGQIWIREDATSPWLVDFLLSAVPAGQWTFKRDSFVNMPWDEATWRDDDGIAYETPEITLLYKAKHDREKDRADLGAALPHMSPEAVDWLRRQIERTHPGHAWLDAIG